MSDFRMDWSNLNRTAPDWFRDAKFGLFFHWGPYSVPACMNEWYSRNMYAKGLDQNRWHEEHYGKLSRFGYKDFIPMFTGEAFDPAQWAALVKRSGAVYAGPVTEHADNFSMWDSAVNPVNSMKMGPHRDVFGECARAFRAEGIKVAATFHHQWLWGWFMSTDNEADVYDPANEVFYGPALPLETNRYLPYRYPDAKFNRTWADKINEVVDKYSPDLVYYDSRLCIIAEEYLHEAAQHYYERVPGGIMTYKQSDFPDNIGVYDVELGHFAEAKPFVWQCDDRLEDNITWCIVQKPKYKSARRIIHQLCDIVAKNGNLLLNVGPCADGSFHPDAVKELYAIGDWLSLNGEAIYCTRPWHTAVEGPAQMNDEDFDTDKLHEQLKNGNASDVRFTDTLGSGDWRFTCKGDTVYAICMGWPENGQFTIRALGSGRTPAAIKSVTMPGCDAPLGFEQTAEALNVTAPAIKPCDHAHVLRIEF